ncbi:MAG: flagellar hook-length control protein FliK, partial [Chlorobia bacterium]|nr:flagellar hook-length control protein FliK [Fimbriimonadaceae bacterium]
MADVSPRWLVPGRLAATNSLYVRLPLQMPGRPTKDVYWLDSAQDEMDISLLGLALGATPEPTSQVPGVPGFEVALEQVEFGGFIPPGAPPGPEPPPPPDILPTVEEVEGTEPNAQPQKLDFQPMQKIDLDIDLPEPFWTTAASSNPETPVASELEPVNEAMNWLASQMIGGFFSQPILPSPSADVCPSPKTPKVPEVSGPCPTPWTPDIPVVSTTCPSPSASGIPEVSEPCPTPLTPGIVFGEPIPVDLVGMPQNGEGSLKELYRPPVSNANQALPKGIPDEVLAVVNVQSIQVEEPQETQFDRTKQSDREPLLAPSILTAETRSSEVAVATDPLLQKKPTDKVSTEPKVEKADLKVTSVSTDRAIREVVSANPQPATGRFGTKRTSTEHTTVGQTSDIALESANAGETAPGNRFGSRPQQIGGPSQVTDREPTLTEGVVEVESVVEVPIGRLDRHSAPRMFGTDIAPITAEAKPEPLKSGVVDLVVKQVTDKLHMLAAARPRNGVTIHLNPEDLGSITMVVKSIGRMVDTQLAASDPRVREALDQNQSRLIEAMDSRGYHLQTVTVSQQSGHSTQQESTKNWQQQSQQQNQSQSGHSHGHRGQSERQFEPP